MGRDEGYTSRAQTMYELSLDWYARRGDPDWQPLTTQEAEEVFRRHGLTDEFWSLG